jgi:hypothetical protein
MQNEANFQKSQVVVTQVLTTNYNEKCKMDTWSKRTQTKPILPAPMAGKIALSLVEGPVQDRTILSRLSAIALATAEAQPTMSVVEPSKSLLILSYPPPAGRVMISVLQFGMAARNSRP